MSGVPDSNALDRNAPTVATLGILGGGQLAQMLALAAIPLGVRAVVLEPSPDAGAALCARHICAPYDDKSGLAALAKCDAVTLEFENVPVAALEYLEGRVPVRPGPGLLAHSKHRVREKESLRAAGVGTAEFVEVAAKADLPSALEKVGGAGILKTSELGYDGKGQRRVSSAAELQAAWDELGRVPCVLEGVVPFAREVSIGVARSAAGDLAFGPLVENLHRDGILRTSLYLGGDEAAAAKAREMARKVAEAWKLEGLMTLEFFELPSGELLVNEVAPRVHNSGHLTQDGGGISQFEAQVRAVLGLPLASWKPLHPTAMVNWVGREDAAMQPDWAAIDALEGTHIHLYHKAHRAGRKLGHVGLSAPDAETLRARLERLEQLIP